MDGYYYGGMLFGVVVWRFVLSMAMIIMGILMIGCGVNVCWLRFGRRRSKEPPRLPSRW